MRIAWFRPDVPDTTSPLDSTASVIAGLGAWHAIDVFTAASAHDFVWRHRRAPWDVCVYELGNSSAYDFVWGYLLNYPGVLWLRSRTLHDSRAEQLERRGRVPCYDEEFRFNEGRPPRHEWRLEGHAGRGRYPMLRVPMLASRAVVSSHDTAAAALAELCPTARVQFVPPAAPAWSGHRSTPVVTQAATPASPATLTVGVFDDERGVVDRAVRRAQATGTACQLLAEREPRAVLEGSDIVVVLDWPPDDAPPTACLAAMAAGSPLVTFDLESTVGWPSFDPQAGRARTPEGAAPIAVTLDPRDEEHSLMLAIRRLATDAPLRTSMGDAARRWWAEHATPEIAARVWNDVLVDAASREPPGDPAWPPHLSWDGTELSRQICDEVAGSQG